jgi:Tol biopolymer transport system component
MTAEMPPLIPRETLLGTPKRWQPTLSPDGSRLAYLAPNDLDVLQIWVRKLGKDDDRCVSSSRRPVHYYQWCWDSKTILCAQDTEGDENWHIYAVDLESRNVRDLTPWQGVRCHYLIMSVKHPGEMLACSTSAIAS